MSEEALKARDPLVPDTAGNGEAERGEVVADVQREPVGGDPARDPNTDGRDLLLPHPAPREAGDALCPKAVVGAREDQHLFEIPDIAVDIPPVRGEIEDRIADRLAGAVIGDVAPPPAFEDLEAPGRKCLRGEEEMVSAGVAPEREDRFVFEEEERVGDRRRLALRHQGVLDLEGAGVRHEAQPLDPQGARVEAGRRRGDRDGV